MAESSNLAYTTLNDAVVLGVYDKIKFSQFKQTENTGSNNDDVQVRIDQKMSKTKQIQSFFTKLIPTKNKCLIALIIFMLSLISGILLILNVSRGKSNSKNVKNKFCLTDKCILTSSYIFNKMNIDADPCDDFYEYSCGNWMKTNLIPRGRGSWSEFGILDYQDKIIIKAELESDDSSVEYTEAELKAKAYYRSCVDKDGLIEKLGAKPILNIVSKFVHLDEGNNLNINISLNELILMIHTEFLNGTLFELNVDFNSKNSSVNSMKIKPVKLDFEPAIYLNHTIKENKKALDRMKETVNNVIKLTHGSVSNFPDIADSYINVSTELAGLISSTGDETIPIKKLNETIAPYLGNGEVFFQTYLNKFNSTEMVDKNTNINVEDVQYFKNLTKWIKIGNEESVKLFLYVKLLKHLAQFASKDFRDQVETFDSAVTGPGGLNVERWQECIERIDDVSRLGLATSRLFLRRKMFNETYRIVSDMTDRVRNALVLNLKYASWMDDETYKLVVEKANYTKKVMGYPEFLMDDAFLNLRYKTLVMNESDWFSNELQLIQYPIELSAFKNRYKLNFTEWGLTPTEVNAFYEPNKNQMNFPSAILQHPFFSVNSSKSLNFASIGFVIGHELSHGFDNTGRQYDKDGNYIQWWSNKTIEAYNNATSCIIEQYTQYQAYGKNLNGIQNLGENIADNGGIKAAFYAYLKWIEENGEEEALPLLNLSQKQLFYVAYAQNWCYKATYDRDYNLLTKNAHALEKFRALGVVSNSREFSENFNCKVGAKMNPLKKCGMF